MAPAGSEGRLERDRAENIARVEAATAEVEHDADAVLSRHPRLSRVASLSRAVLSRQSADDLGLAASGATFWLVISAFPTGTAVVSLFGLVVSPNEVAVDLGRLARTAPSSLGSLITDQLRRVATADRTGLSIGLAISLVLAVWSASAGVYNLDRAIRYSYGLPRQRYVEARTRALVAAAALVIVLGGLALGGSVAGGHVPAVVSAVVAGPVVFLVLAAGIASMYRFSIGPTVGIRQLVPGAVAAAVAVAVALGAFALYLAVSTRYTAVYGAFAGLVIGMIGSYVAVYAVLLGAMLNAQLQQRAGAAGR